MLNKFKETMDCLYSEAQEQATRYRNLDANVADCYFEFSHQLYGITAVAMRVCTAEEHVATWNYATELRNKFWEEEVQGVR